MSPYYKQLRQQFIEKMAIEVGSSDAAETIAMKYVDTLPEVLIPNIVEWCEEQPLSEIEYKGLSLPAIMYYRKPYPLTMKATLQAFRSWQELNNPDPARFLSLYVGGIR